MKSRSLRGLKGALIRLDPRSLAMCSSPPPSGLHRTFASISYPITSGASRSAVAISHVLNTLQSAHISLSPRISQNEKHGAVCGGFSSIGIGELVLLVACSNYCGMYLQLQGLFPGRVSLRHRGGALHYASTTQYRQRST